ncbi:MAG: hypothetical protein GX349_07465 [Firmicutes bacterium]|nr:hypothetical protein [Bacillota bacterium]
MPHLKIHTTHALIGIKQTWPRLDTHTHIPHLPRQTTYPRVILEREEPRLTIDQTHVWAQLGYRQRRHFADYTAQKGQAAALKGIKKKAQEGDRLTRFYSGEDAIAAIAREAAFSKADLNISCWPTHPPRIKVNPGGLAIDFEPGGTSSAYTPARVEGHFTWGHVRVYMRQKAKVEIEARLDRRA